MNLYAENENYKLYQGNMLDMLDVIQPESIDSIITDPPYELNFMNKGWDNSGIAFQKETWERCFKVLKSGGYLLAFGGSRTFHRIACAIEDAGFEIRDTIMWLYGSGFPKSMDISKQIDKKGGNDYSKQFAIDLKQARESRNLTMKYCDDKYCNGSTNWSWYEGRKDGCRVPDYQTYLEIIKEFPELEKYKELIKEAEREVIGTKKSGGASAWINGMNNKENEEQKYTGFSEWEITAPTTDLAKQWQGWGTALKPSFEPIIVARKPFKGSLVDNVIEYGVGGINIDECRVRTNDNMKPTKRGSGVFSETANGKKTGWNKNDYNGDYQPNNLGRFPANTILTYDDTDFDEVCGGFPITNPSKQIIGGANRKSQTQEGRISSGGWKETNRTKKTEGYNDNGGNASRYFYCAKTSKKDRDEGCQDLEDTVNACSNQAIAELKRGNDTFSDEINSTFNKVYKGGNTHPTVKPTELMQYLVRLVSPDGATILDPFNGSGSTGKAVMYENKERNKNYKYIGIELTEEYLPISKARIEYVCNLKPQKEPQMTIFECMEENE